MGQRCRTRIQKEGTLCIFPAQLSVPMLIERQFKKAYQEHLQECNSKPPDMPSLVAHRKSLVGTFTITHIDHTSDPSLAPGNFYYIVSLITSAGYGKHMSDPTTILDNTAKALRVLKATTDRFKTQLPKQELKVYAVKINSGLFNVPWDATKRVLEAGEVDMTILIPPSSTNPANTVNEEMTEPSGPGPQNKRRRHVSQSPPPSKPSSPKKRNTAKARIKLAPAVESAEPTAQGQTNADRDARHTQRAAQKGSPRMGWED